MKIKYNTGARLQETINGILEDLMERYSVSRVDARKLLAESLVRNVVYNEITDMCDWLLGKDE